MDDVKNDQKVNTDTLKVDDLDEFPEDGSGEHLTTNQGLRINDDQRIPRLKSSLTATAWASC